MIAWLVTGVIMLAVAAAIALVLIARVLVRVALVLAVLVARLRRHHGTQGGRL